jgi:hypothetical protein
MGEAKRRGTFDERREWALANRVVATVERPKPGRRDVAVQRRMTPLGVLMAMAAAYQIERRQP